MRNLQEQKKLCYFLKHKCRQSHGIGSGALRRKIPEKEKEKKVQGSFSYHLTSHDDECFKREAKWAQRQRIRCNLGLSDFYVFLCFLIICFLKTQTSSSVSVKGYDSDFSLRPRAAKKLGPPIPYRDKELDPSGESLATRGLTC